MAFFNWRNNDGIFDNGDDDEIDYSELDGYEFTEDEYEIIERMRDEVTGGDCLYCDARDSMEHDGDCFICSVCGKSVHEDVYFAWAGGIPIEIEDC